MLKWKIIEGIRAIKARLVVRGFKDSQANDLLTAASTASRWGQRLVNQLVAQMEWELFSFDVSSAFLQGLTLDQLKGAGPVDRVVHLEPPKVAIHLHAIVGNSCPFFWRPGYELP